MNKLELEKAKAQSRKKILELQKEALKIETLNKKYEDENRIQFFKPFPYQQKALDYLNAGKKTVIMQGANRIGKTVIGACFVGSECLGATRPWDGTPTIFKGKPIRVRILCEDWEDHAAQVVVPKLREWLPLGSYTTKKNNVGVEAHWYFKKTKSEIQIVTGKQETRQQEGWSGHIFWPDEPPARDKYITNTRGLIDYDGVTLFTMTAVSEAWVYDEIVLGNDPNLGAVTEVQMEENPSLSKDAIANFASKLSEEEYEARIKGGWLSLSGLVLKDFDRDLHLIERFKVPTHWPVVPMIDLHVKKPHAISYNTVDQRDIWYTIGETWKNMPPEGIADDILRKKKENNWNITEAYIDPLAKGDSAFMRNRADVEDSFTIISDILSRHNIILHTASKDKDSGIRNMQEGLKGLNGMPSWFMFDDLERHIYEIQRWKYDKNGKPGKVDDDMMEDCYRFTLTGTQYIQTGAFHYRKMKLNI